MRQKQTSASLGQSQEMFHLQAVIQFHLVLGGQRLLLLPFNEPPNALARLVRRLEFNDFPRTERSNELNNFFVRFHNHRFAWTAFRDKPRNYP
jgi:hypothetical protein